MTPPELRRALEEAGVIASLTYSSMFPDRVVVFFEAHHGRANQEAGVALLSRQPSVARVEVSGITWTIVIVYQHPDSQGGRG